MRNRTMGPTTAVSQEMGRRAWAQQWNNGTNYSGENSYATEYVSEYNYKDMDDVVTPAFRARSGRGEIIINPMKITTTRYLYPCFTLSHAGVWTWADPKMQVEVSGVFGPWRAGLTSSAIGYGNLIAPSPPTAPDYSGAAEDALTEARARSHESRTLLLVTLKELGETRDELVRIFTALNLLMRTARGRADPKEWARFIRKSRRGYRLSWRDAAKLLPSYWLEWRYGIRQLFFETKAIVDAIDSIGERTRTRFTAKRTLAPLTNEDPGTATACAGVPIPAYHRSETTCDVLAGVLMQPTTDEISVVQALGLTELTRSIWDSLPLSFVVDWFSNVGDWLVAMSPNFYAREVGSWYTVETTSRRVAGIDAQSLAASNLDWNVTTPVGTGGGFVSACECFEETRTLERVANPIIVGSLPGMEVRLGVQQWADLTALLAQYAGAFVRKVR